MKLEMLHPHTGEPTGLILTLGSAEAPADDLPLDAVSGWEWQGDANWGGVKLPFTPENLKAVLGVFAEQIREAVTVRDAEFAATIANLCEAVMQTCAGGHPDIEPDAERLWGWFWDISDGRQPGMSGWCALPALEIKAWSDLTGNLVSPVDLRALRAMDRAFLKATAQSADGEGLRRENAPELTMDAFDAVFG